MKSVFSILEIIQLVACDWQLKSEEKKKFFDKFQHKIGWIYFCHFIKNKMTLFVTLFTSHTHLKASFLKFSEWGSYYSFDFISCTLKLTIFTTN